MRRLVALILAALAFVRPSAALTPAQELVLFGGGGTTYYANPTSGQIPPWLSYASAGVRYYFDAAGNLRTAPNNQIRNSTMLGAATGAPGAIPTNWSYATVSGVPLTNTVVSLVAGVPTIDLTFAGTPTATGNIVLAFDTNTSARASMGQTWMSSAMFSLSGGSVAGTTGFTLLLEEYSTGGSWLANSTIAFTPTGTPTPVFGARTLSSASVVYFNTYVSIGVTISVPVNFTLRISSPQASLITNAQTTPSPFAPTGGSAYYGPVVNDYNPSTLAALGLRSEPQRTNLLLSSTSFTIGSFWQIHTGDITFTSVTSNAGLAPDGSNNAALLSNTGGQVNPIFGLWQSVSLPNTIGTISLWLKAGSLTTANLNITGYSSDTSLGGGVVTLTSQWKRFSFTASSTDGVGYRFQVSTNAQAGNFYVWGGQLEASTFATSPILTYGSAVTVPADNWSFTGVALAALRSPTGCYAVEFTPEGLTTGFNSIIKSASTGSFGTGVTTAATETSLTNITYITTNAISPTVNAKSCVAAKWAPENYAVATNGAGLTTSAFGNAQTPAAAYYLGQDGTAGPLSAWFSQIMIRQNCTAAQVRRYSTAGANLRGN